MKKILLLTTVTALLSSCGIYTKYQPETTAPDNLYGEGTAVVDTANLGNVDWRELFTDPRLQELIEQGLQSNTDYLSAQLRVEEAKATLLSAKLAFLPSFSLAPQGTVSSFDKQKAVQAYSLPVTASWELDIFGRMRNAKRQAKALYAQSQDYQQAVRTQLIAGIANTYYTLLMLDEQLSLTQQTEQAWKETVVSARALMEAGQYNEAGVSQMEATYYSVQTSILDLKEQINQVENSLALLLAETPRHYERGTLSAQHFTQDLSVGIPMQMLANRPDVRSAERSLEAAFYGTNQARSAFYPSIVLNRGQVIAQYRISKAQQEEARLFFEQALLNAGSEVNDALTACQTSREKTVLFDKQIVSLQKALKSTSLLMEHGTTNYLEVLTARQTLLSAQLSQTANRFTEIQSVISLYQALGGGRE